MLKSADNARKEAMALDENESTTTATSLDDDLTVKRSNNADTKSPKKRPDSLNLSFNYNESSLELAKMTPSFNQQHHHHHRHHLNSSANNNGNNPNVIQNSCASSTVDVNQSKSLSVDGNKSHHDGKKSTTSYDLWVNEAVGMKEKSENIVGDGGSNNTTSSNVAVAAREKKLDLPGRVSFSFRYVKEEKKKKKFFQARNNYILCVPLPCPSTSVRCWMGGRRRRRRRLLGCLRMREKCGIVKCQKEEDL